MKNDYDYYQYGLFIKLYHYDAIKYILQYNDLENLNDIQTYKIILKKQSKHKYELTLTTTKLNYPESISLNTIIDTYNVINIMLRCQYINEALYLTHPLSITDSLMVAFYVDDNVIDYNMNNPILNRHYWKIIHKRAAMRETFLYMNDLAYLEKLVYN